MPHQPRSVIDSDDLADLTGAVLDFTANTGPRRIAAPEREFDYDESGKSLELEAFMHEPVVIQLAEQTSENDVPMVFVGVNGDTRVLPRGIPIRVQRKFVERLAQSQEGVIIQKLTNDDAADDRYINKVKQRQSYPVQLLQDKNPVGRRWFARMVREGC